jgi:hypothetical protein
MVLRVVTGIVFAILATTAFAAEKNLRMTPKVNPCPGHCTIEYEYGCVCEGISQKCDVDFFCDNMPRTLCGTSVDTGLCPVTQKPFGKKKK